MQGKPISAVKRKGQEFSPPPEFCKDLPLQERRKPLGLRVGDDLLIADFHRFDPLARKLRLQEPSDGFHFRQFRHVCSLPSSPTF